LATVSPPNRGERSTPLERTNPRRPVGHGLDSPMDWIGLDCSLMLFWMSNTSKAIIETLWNVFSRLTYFNDKNILFSCLGNDCNVGAVMHWCCDCVLTLISEILSANVRDLAHVLDWTWAS